MSLKKVQVTNIDELLNTLSKEKNVNKKFLLFTGSKNESNECWCPDCVASEPVIQECLSNFEKNFSDLDALFVTVYVGLKPEWKDSKNSFRVHPQFKINCIPTLLQFETVSLFIFYNIIYNFI